jgi:tetratricopeptide (TPR) repeat protein
MADRFVRPGQPKVEYPPELFETSPPATRESAAAERARLQELARHPPPRKSQTPSLEATDPALTDALRTLGTVPTAASHLAVANEYRRLGVLDRAYDHYDAARAIDRRSAAAYDGLARVWRDVNRPDRALPEASRAVYFAPGSPEIQNTLGTILLTLGRTDEARKAFAKALALDPSIDYAWFNTGVADMRDKAYASAASAFTETLRLNPAFPKAQDRLKAALEASHEGGPR